MLSTWAPPLVTTAPARSPGRPQALGLGHRVLGDLAQEGRQLTPLFST